MHGKHLAWINDKGSSTKKSAYTVARSAAQKILRQIKESWWSATAELLQDAADRHDMKSFYDGLKAVYGPRDTGSIPVCSRDGTTLITDCSGILSRWAEHFHGVLNQPTTASVVNANSWPAIHMKLRYCIAKVRTHSNCNICVCIRSGSSLSRARRQISCDS